MKPKKSFWNYWLAKDKNEDNKEKRFRICKKMIDNVKKEKDLQKKKEKMKEK